MNPQETIETAIYRTLNDPRFNDQPPTQINQGNCEAFAQSLTESVTIELQTLTTADITGGDPTTKPDPWHVWVTDGTLHYDAETPSGVETWSALPFWNRITTKNPTVETDE